MPQKKAMVGWFDPAQLAQTAVRVAVSTVFGEFADKREALAAANPIDDATLDRCFDYRERCGEGEFWLDFVADTGDGWNPTYAIARLLAAGNLQPTGAEGPLPRGRILVMGGDQVYPTASQEEYGDRLVYPFEEAHRRGGGAPLWPADAASLARDGPDVYAIPGNHDWYDGLKTFFHLFCRRTVKPPRQAAVNRPGSVIGGRQTWQTRSYFALRLPNGWWLWGTDSQLEGYIDQPQIDFFQFVAEKWMEPGSKLVLCAGTPDWEYVNAANADTKYATMSYLERLAPAAAGKGHELKLVLSGDSHHYARFLEGERNYITCGGGGAFLHPTHHIPKGENRFQTRYPPPGVAYDPHHGPYDRSFRLAAKAGTGEEALFPDRATSRGLGWKTIFFAVQNWKFTALLLPIYFLFTWLLDFNAWVFHGQSLAALLAPLSWGGAMHEYWVLVFSSPWPTLLAVIGWLFYLYFCDAVNQGLRFVLGTAHALAQAVVVTAATVLIVQALAPCWAGLIGIGGGLLAASLVSAFISATVFGTYLALCIPFGVHWEHLSALAIEDYKSFLRLRIGKDGALTVFPIGLTKVEKDDGDELKNPRLTPHLIEPAIRIP